jgi:hypothetical protein
VAEAVGVEEAVAEVAAGAEAEAEAEVCEVVAEAADEVAVREPEQCSAPAGTRPA